MEEKKKVKSISSSEVKEEVDNVENRIAVNRVYDEASDLEIIRAYENRSKNRLKLILAFIFGIIATIALFSMLGVSNKGVATNTKSDKNKNIEPGYVGIYVVNLEDINAIDYFGLDLDTNLRKGAVIETVVNTGPAFGKLKKEDIIVEIDNRDIENTNDVVNEIAKHNSGEKVVFAVEREGKLKDITVTLGTK